MENKQENAKDEQQPNKLNPAAQEGAEQDDVQFENASVDPGFATEEEETTGGEASADNAPSNDALNYKNDRDHGAYNPKNI